jgi:hypothetical protein
MSPVQWVFIGVGLVLEGVIVWAWLISAPGEDRRR